MLASAMDESQVVCAGGAAVEADGVFDLINLKSWKLTQSVVPWVSVGVRLSKLDRRGADASMEEAREVGMGLETGFFRNLGNRQVCAFKKMHGAADTQGNLVFKR